MYAGCNVESKSDPSLNVTALRTTILKAVSDGETKFQGLVLSSQTEEFPIPDGTGRQFLSEYGDFPVFCVNMDLEVKRFTTFQLFPMAANVANKKRKTRTKVSKDEGVFFVKPQNSLTTKFLTHPLAGRGHPPRDARRRR